MQTKLTLLLSSCLLLTACSDSTTSPSEPDSSFNDMRSGDATIRDSQIADDRAVDVGATDGPSADTNPSDGALLPDLSASDSAQATDAPICTTQAPNAGIYLNPGCDPDVQSQGIGSMGRILYQGNELFQFTTGKKWWNFDFTANSGTGAFITAGTDAAAAYRNLSPSCSTMMDGIHLNPGCDPDVQKNGVTAMGSFSFQGSTLFQVTAGKKAWNFDFTADGGNGAFISATADAAASYRNFQPSCATMMDGIHLNPGCDPDLQKNGVTAMGSITFQGATLLQVTAGKKAWNFDFTANGGNGAFISATADAAKAYLGFAPTCAETLGGVHLNPGCDPDVQANGITAMGNFAPTGTSLIQLTTNKKWWVFDPLANSGSGAFVNAGADIAEACRWLPPL